VNTQTSATDPIYVTWLPTRGRGRVGLSIAPGKHQRGAYSGIDWKRDLATDLDQLRKDDPDLSADVIVSLLEPAEYDALNIGAYHDEVRRRGFELLELNIRDAGVPKSHAAVADLVTAVDSRVRDGKRVVIHCAGGIGRSGVIGGCLLVRQGLTTDEVFAALRVRSDKCPETEPQRQYIRDFARRPSRASRIRGAVLGAAIGDAMGHPTEFLDMPAIHQRFGPDGVRGFELWWERDGARFAPYTDDTQMAEVVLATLIDARTGNHGLDAAMQQMARGFVTWAEAPQGGHRAPGNACLAGCRALASGAPWDEAGGAKAGGCGSVMRAYPFGLLFADDAQAEEWAVAHSKPTHRDPIALAACAAMAVAMVRIMADRPVNEVLAAMVDAAARYSSETSDMIACAIEEARAGVGPEVTLDRLRAWAAHEAIAAAAYLFCRHSDDVEAAILEGANTPGDSDSIATLAGALVGARGGVNALSGAWVRDVERSSELSALAFAADDATGGARV